MAEPCRRVRSLTDLCLENFWLNISRLALMQTQNDARLDAQSPNVATNVRELAMLTCDSIPQPAANYSELKQYCQAIRSRFGVFPTELGDRLIRRIAYSITLDDEIAEALFDQRTGIFHFQRSILRMGLQWREKMLWVLAQSRQLRSLDCSYTTLSASQLTFSLNRSFSTLTELHLNHVSLSDESDELPSLFSQLARLQLLHVAYSRFTGENLHAVCCSGAPISSLDISGCRIATFSPLLQIKNTLTELVVRDFERPLKIEELANFHQLKNLQVLDFSVHALEQPEQLPHSPYCKRHICTLIDLEFFESVWGEMGTVWPKLKHLNASGWPQLTIDTIHEFVRFHPLLETVLMAFRDAQRVFQVQVDVSQADSHLSQLQLFTERDFAKLVVQLESAASSTFNWCHRRRALRLLNILNNMIEFNDEIVYHYALFCRTLAATVQLAETYFNDLKVFQTAVRISRIIVERLRFEPTPVDIDVRQITCKLIRLCMNQYESLEIFGSPLVSSLYNKIVTDIVEILWLGGVQVGLELTGVVSPMRLLKLCTTAINYTNFVPDQYTKKVQLSRTLTGLIDFHLPKLAMDDTTHAIKQAAALPVVEQLVDVMVSLLRLYSTGRILMNDYSRFNVAVPEIDENYRRFVHIRVTNALWNVTDENPVASRHFMRVAFRTYIDLLEACERECAGATYGLRVNIRKKANQFRVLACLNNVMEVPECREQVSWDSLKTLCSCLHAHDSFRVVFFACGVVSNILVSMKKNPNFAVDQFKFVCNELSEGVEYLNVSQQQSPWSQLDAFVNYTTLRPFYLLIGSSIEPVQYFGCTLINIMLAIDKNRYAKLLKDECPSVLQASSIEAAGLSLRVKQSASAILCSL